MADEKITIATAANYWISQNALSIQLNALGEADRIQAGVASGAEIMVFIRGVKPASSGAEYDKNGDGLEYDNGHNYRHWPLTISPTYFNDSEVRYLYVAVPRSASVGTEAMVVFPPKKLDIYGYEVIETTSGQTTTVSRGTQLGSDDYFYIWLQAVISAVQTDKTPNYRKWLSPVEPGYLNSDEAYSTSETSWYRWDPISQIVTFTKEIWMDAASWFQNLQAVDGLFKGQLTVKGLFDALMARIDKISSHDFVSGLLDGSGWRLTNDNGEGGSELEVDFLKVRKKATFMELEVRKETFVGGNQHYSPAGSIIYRVDYMDANDQALGYVSMKVPWMLKGFAFLGKKAQNRILNYAAKKKVRRGLTDDEWPKVKYFRCYLLADDGTTATRNWWRAGDQVRCQTWNKAKSGNKSTNWSETGSNYHYKVEESVDATVASNTYYWRMVNKVGSARLEDNKVYDYIDLLYEGWSQATDANSYRAPGSDKPDAGDMIVCMGNRYDENRMNMISLYTTGNDNNPPAIKGYRGIHSFSLTNQNRVFEISPEEVLFRSKNFYFLNDNGYKLPPVLDRGEWVKGTRYHYYDRVSWKGSMWLCIINDDDLWQYANSKDARAADVTDITIEEGDFPYTMVIGGVTYTGTDHYSKRGKVNGTPVYYIRNYTTTEPSKDASGVWLRQVSKGTEIIKTEVAYAASKSGTTPPADSSTDWKTVGKGERTPDTDDAAINATGINDANHTYGVYLWTRKKTYYDDPNDPDRKPTVEYTVVRWGIDANGIYRINSYYLATSDNSLMITSANDSPNNQTYPIWMPSDSGYASANAQHKWYDTFDRCASDNGGVGKMQGWLVWEKTVIKYDKHYNKDGTEDTKADVVNYKSSRIGQDGQIGQEEYYMLAASDDFATVFGNPSQPASYYYAKTGIRWYTEDTPSTTDLPAAERWRLSSTTPNVNTSMWSPTMPTYNKSTHGAKVYLWNFEKRIDGQGTEYATKPVCIGNHARGIKGVRELYALSASQTPVSSSILIPQDLYDKNGYGVVPTSGFNDQQVWSDEKFDRAPTENLPYQWNWTRTLYSSPKDASDTARDKETGYYFEDHYHVSAVRGTRGQDGSGVEYIYCRPQSHDANGNPLTVTLPDPNILKDKDGHEKTADEIKKTDDFIPYNYTDNPVGIDFTHQIEYQAERKSSATTGTGGFTGGHKWGQFSQPKVWSKWGKNGMDGDGTEYVFIRTKNNVAPILSSSTGKDSYGRSAADAEYLPVISNNDTTRTDATKAWAETNGKAGECTDDPKGTTRDWPYEWVAKRTMAAPNAQSGAREWKSYYTSVGSPYKMSLWANYAENAMRLDLSNEMDMVLTDSTGKVEKARTVTTVVTVYDGAKKATGVILNDTVSTLAIGTKANGQPNKPVISGDETTDSYTITWTFAVGDRINATNPVTVDVVYLNYPHSAVFTLAASMGQPIYQLRPTLNSVNFSRTDANALTPDSRDLGLKILKIDGDSTTELSSAPSGYTVRYGTSAMPASKTAGTAWGTSDGTTGITWSGNIMAIANSVTIGDVFIALFYGDVVIDRETVPVLKDGAHGENSVRLDLTNENDSMLYDGQGNRLSQKVTSTAYLYDGAEDVSSKVSKWTVTASGCSLESSSSSPNITVSGMTEDNGTVTVQAEYTDGHNQKHTKSAILTLKKLVGVDKYDLDVSPNALVLNTSDGWSAAKTVTVKVMRTPANGGTPAAINPATASYNVQLSVALSDGTSITPSGSGTSRTFKITQAQATANEGVTVTLYKTGDTSSVLDRETIPFNKAENGDGIVSVTRKYQLSASGNAPSGRDYPTDIDDTKWETSSPGVTAAKPYLWCQEITDYKYQADTTRYYCVGARGTNGVDAQDVEYVFARTTTSAAPSVSNNNDYTIGGVTHKVTDDDYKPAVSGAYTIGSGGTPTLSAYATDDPQGVTEKLPYEWIAKRTKGSADATTGKRSWQGYPIGAMKLYATFSESPYTADLDNEMDAVHVSDICTVTRASGVSTKAMLFKGTVAQKFIIKKVTRYSLNGSGEREHVQEFSAGSTHDSVTVGFVAALNDSRAVTVTYAQGAKMYGTDYYEIAITTDGEAQTFTLTFTVVATTGDVYKVLPTVNGVVSSAVHLTRSASDDSKLVVSGTGSTFFRIGAKYRKTTANGQSSTGEITSISFPNVDGIYSAMYRLRSLSNGEWGSYKRLGSSLETVSVNTYDAAETVICSNAGDLENTTIDRETIYFIADGKKGKDGTTPTINISDDGYWIINGVIVTDGDGNPIKAEGIDGTGVAIKGEVANQAAREALTGMSKGDCYIQSDNRHLYMWDGNVWIDLGEFKGEPGKNSYMHIAYARTLTFTNGVITAVTGFTVDNDGGTYDWMGFCTDNSETDPGRGASSTDVTAANKYKWNYMKGRDGSGVEYIYLLTKKGFTPAIDESGGYPDPVGGHVHNDPSKDEFWPKVSLEGTGGTPDDIYGGTRYWYDDPPASVSYEWPMLWWAKREYSYNETTGKSAWGSFGRVMLHNKWTEDAVRIDLDNENDTMLYTSGGTRVSGEIKSTGYLFDGNTDVSTLSGVTWAIKSSTGCTASIVGRTVTVTKMSAVKGSVEVKATYNGVEYVATLTLKKIVDGDKYELVITPNAIAYNATTGKPAASTLAIQVWKTTVNSSGGVSRVLSSPPSAYGVYANGEALTDMSLGTYSYTTVNSVISEVAVKIARKYDSADILDAETVPVTKAENGASGKNGDTPISCYRWYEETLTPTKPTDVSSDEPASADYSGSDQVYPTDRWSKSAPNRPADGWNLWMCQSTKHTSANNTVTRDAWTGPVRISGAKGSAGEDGSDMEYIYILKTGAYNFPDNEKPASITIGEVSPGGHEAGGVTSYSTTKDDWVPQGWWDNPRGIDNTNIYEYMSWRRKEKGSNDWGPFSEPVIWSHYGERGMDGDGVEYVFMRTTGSTAPRINDNESVDSRGHNWYDDEYLPRVAGGVGQECTDDPAGVTSYYKYEWVASRKKVLGSDGKTRSWPKYNLGAMKLWAMNGKSGETVAALFQWGASASTPSVSAGDYMGGSGPFSGWYKTAINRPDGDTTSKLWMSQATIVTDDGTNYSFKDNVGWSTPVWISGADGTAGEDAKEREWVYKLSDTNPGTPTDPTDRTIDDYVPSGWSDNPAGVDDTNKTEYASWRDYDKTNKMWGNFHTPIVWSHYGERGMDGDGVEYVFMRTTGSTAPRINDNESVDSRGHNWYDDEYLPRVAGGAGQECTDDPAGVTSYYKYEWVASRKKVLGSDGKTRSWPKYNLGAMKLWAMYGGQGPEGPEGPQGPQGKYEVKQYARSSYKTSASGTQPPQDCVNDNVWLESPPLPEKTQPFIWQRSYDYDPAATQQGVVWHYVRLTGEPGASGSAGKTGLWYRYAGVWGVDIGSVMNTETVGYYVSDGNKNFWMNTLPANQTNYNTPDAGVDGWETMNSVFPYFITKAIFGDYAHFGSFIINGDWMISQYGTSRGGFSDGYELFDPLYPQGSGPDVYHNVNGREWVGASFAPNFAVDGLTGKVYMNDAYVRGQIVATGGEIGGDMRVTGTVSIHSDTYGRSIILNPNDTYGAGISGYNGSDRAFRLGFSQSGEGYLSMNAGYFAGDVAWLVGEGGSAILSASNTDYAGSYMELDRYFNGENKSGRIGVEYRETNNGEYIFIISSNCWPTTWNQVPPGGVYNSGGYLRVRT